MINEKTVRENFEKWNAALLSGDPQQVAKLYHNEASFLPTFSGPLRIGPDEAGGYFDHFLTKRPTGSIVEEKIVPLTPKIYLHTGLYDFEVGPDGGRVISPARFTFVWTEDGGEWKILHHHSSPNQE